MKRLTLFFFLAAMMIGVNQSGFAEIAKEELFRTPAFLSAKISPDGTLIAQVGADEAGILNASVFPIGENRSAPEKLTSFATPEIIQFFWSADSKKVLLLKDENGTGQLNFHGFDVETKAHYSYTEKFPGVNAKVVKISSKKNKAVIGLNHRNHSFHDLYLLDLDTGDLKLLLENDAYAKFLVSDDLEIGLKIKIEEAGSWTIATAADEVAMTLSSEEAFQAEFISCDGSAFYFLDSRYSNTNQLTKKNLASPYEEEVLGGQSQSDVDEVIFVDGKPKAYATYDTQKKWHALDPSFEEEIHFLESQIGPNFSQVSQSRDGRIWIVSNSIPDKGVYHWIYRRDDGALAQLSQFGSDRTDFSKMYEMVVWARDGQRLVCYYTLPKEYDRGGSVDTPIPLVAVPHGGPFKVRDKYEFNPYHQWLANCGYAVLSVNFRLSSGFGKDFLNAGNGEWGGRAHLDVIDAVEACISKGIADRSKLAIFGGSYGGYESLASLAFTPEYFACCVAICGPSNLKTVLGGVPQYWEFTSKPLSDETIFFTKKAFITSMGGDPEDPMGAAYLEKCSPLNYLDQMKAPLLLIHGKNDHIVAESESRQIYERMKEKGKDATYILFPNEGHRFGHFSNKLMSLSESERFLSRQLGGKYRPAPKELVENSSAIVFD